MSEKILNETVKLELMDWKSTERSCQAQIRESLLLQRINEVLLKEARKQIKSYGGKTIEEELEEEKKKRAPPAGTG